MCASEIVKPRACCFEVVINILACYIKFSEFPKTDKVRIGAKRGYTGIFLCCHTMENLTGLYSHNDTLNTLLKKFHFLYGFCPTSVSKKYCTRVPSFPARPRVSTPLPDRLFTWQRVAKSCRVYPSSMWYVRLAACKLYGKIRPTQQRV